MTPPLLREEFVVCGAAGYPDPHRPHPNTRTNAEQFAADHSFDRVAREPVQPVIRWRIVSDWHDLPAEPPGIGLSGNLRITSDGLVAELAREHAAETQPMVPLADAQALADKVRELDAKVARLGRERAEALNDAEASMGDRNLSRSELDDIAALFGLDADASGRHGEILARVRELLGGAAK